MVILYKLRRIAGKWCAGSTDIGLPSEATREEAVAEILRAVPGCSVSYSPCEV
jgi:hypothetical protein